jgi:hypothetical protein
MYGQGLDQNFMSLKINYWEIEIKCTNLLTKKRYICKLINSSRTFIVVEITLIS